MRMRLEPSHDGQTAVSTGDTHELPVQLLLQSVGYRAQALEGVPFDSSRSVIPNTLGRVLTAPGSTEVVHGLYVTGWLARGPSGIIGTNLVDAQQVAMSVVEDLAKLSQVTGRPVTAGSTPHELRALLTVRIYPPARIAGNACRSMLGGFVTCANHRVQQSMPC